MSRVSSSSSGCLLLHLHLLQRLNSPKNLLLHRWMRAIQPAVHLDKPHQTIHISTPRPPPHLQGNKSPGHRCQSRECLECGPLVSRPFEAGVASRVGTTKSFSGAGTSRKLPYMTSHLASCWGSGVWRGTTVVQTYQLSRCSRGGGAGC